LSLLFSAVVKHINKLIELNYENVDNNEREDIWWKVKISKNHITKTYGNVRSKLDAFLISAVDNKRMKRKKTVRISEK
jgi:hypothetical protein